MRPVLSAVRARMAPILAFVIALCMILGPAGALAARQATMRAAVRIDFVELSTATGASSSTISGAESFVRALDQSSGTSDATVDRFWSGTATATTTPASVDLVGSLTSQVAAGATTSFAEVELLVIANNATSGNLIVGGGATPFGFLTTGTTDSLVIPPGGWVVLYFGDAGKAATGGATDLIWLTSSAGSVSYSVWIAGRSA